MDCMSKIGSQKCDFEIGIQFVNHKFAWQHLIIRFLLQTLSATDLRDPEISSRIATKMKEFHGLSMPGPKTAVLWERLRYGSCPLLYFHANLGDDLFPLLIIHDYLMTCFLSSPCCHYYLTSLRVGISFSHLHWCSRKWLQTAKGMATPEEVKAVQLDLIEMDILLLQTKLAKDQRIGFCHNDLQYGNIMMDEGTKSITIIVRSIFFHRSSILGLYFVLLLGEWLSSK